MKAGVELRHLVALECLADELHFGRAAERLGMAQAQLSQLIRQLELRLGVRLFDRTTRSVALTAAGAVLHGHARDVLGRVDEAVAHTRATTGIVTGSLVVGGVHVALLRQLPPIIRRFRTDYPAVTVDVVPMTTAAQIKALSTGAINLAFLRPTAVASFMAVEPLATEGFVSVLPQDHPLAAAAEVRLADLGQQPMIGYAPILGARYATILDEALERARVRLLVVQETSHTLSVVTLVAAGVGIAVVPAWAAMVTVPGIVYRPVADLPPAVELAVAWRRGDTSALVRGFVTAATEVAPSPGNSSGATTARSQARKP